MFNPRFWALASFTMAVAMTRLLPHPPNFTAVGAMALFGGAFFTRKWTAFAVPLAALVLSDLALAASLYGFMETLVAVPIVYLTFALTVCLGMLLRGRLRAVNIATAAVAATLLHFLLTNFPIWAAGTFYPRTIEGLLACYLAALPYEKNMLLANLVFSGILFGTFAWAQNRFLALREPAVVQSA